MRRSKPAPRPAGLVPRPNEGWLPEPKIDHGVCARLVREFLDAPYPYDARMPNDEYEASKLALQIELLKLQSWLKDTGNRLVVLFEGRDAAGKGSTIKRFVEHLNPRSARVVALDKPSDVERGQWYFQRYIEHLPTAGEIVLFDRSWYNRSGVERVMGFCTEAEYHAFLRQTVELERNLRESGTILIKIWLSVGRDEQKVRFQKRASNPLKAWKLSAIDTASLGRYDEYSAAERAVFIHTATHENPWVVIKSDCKRRARLNAMRYVLNDIEYTGKNDAQLAPLDPVIVCAIRGDEAAAA